MRMKIAFVAGLGVGYVLGARAGRERYEKIMRGMRGVKDNPTVQETAGLIGAQAGRALSTAKGKAGQGVNTLYRKARHKDDEPEWARHNGYVS
jgi:hypothetical protein